MTGLSLPTYSFNSEHTALIIGAGLAGCAIASALAKRGYHCKIFDQHPSIAGATSAIPAAVIRPIITGDKTHANVINEAFKACCDQLPKHLFHQCGLLQVAPSSSANSNHNGNSSDSIWMPANEAATVAGTELKEGAFYIKHAGWINPASLCAHWLQDLHIDFHPNTPIESLRKTQLGWQLLSRDSKVVDESRLVIFANAVDAKKFAVSNHFPLTTSGGQIDYFESACDTPQTILSDSSYIIPTGSSSHPTLLCCGATHHRDQTVANVTATDTAANRQSANLLAPSVNLRKAALHSFAGIRTATPDRMPIVGAVPDVARYLTDYSELRHGKASRHFPPPTYQRGLYAAVGFGSRGATLAVHAGEILAAMIEGGQPTTKITSQLANQNIKQEQIDLLQALHPARFLIRDLRRGL